MLFDVHLDICEQKMYMHSFDLLVYAFLLVDDVVHDFVFEMMESYDVFVVMGLDAVSIVVDVVVVDDS
jgi:hypothetical protein